METEKQSKIIEKKNGGVRPGAGRPKGSIQKISGAAILDALEDTLGIPFEVQLANNYLNALHTDKQLVAKYDQLFLNKVVADKVDITSNGQGIAPTLQFGRSELPDYIDINVKHS